MSKSLAFAVALAGFAASAHAADLDVGSIKDPIPNGLTWNGVTLFGTIDIGYAYQNHGVPLGATYPQTLEYSIWSAKNASKTISTLDASALERSNVGLKIEEGIGGGWLAIGKVETSFNPLSGELSDGPASLLKNYGVPLANQTANGDSNRAGQTFNGEAYAGVSNETYGTLKFGRQQALQTDMLATYDPQGAAYAFSLIGYSASLNGAGDTEAARWDNAVKYIYQYGPVHAAAEYTDGGADTGIFGGAYAFNLGGNYRGFSLDAVYQKERAVVSASAASATTLAGTISDNTSWSVQGKYTYDFGGSLKDEAAGPKLTIYGGYENISFADSSETVTPGSATLSGYILSSITSNAYTTDKVLQVFWTGAKYELPSGWSFTGAYYHADQNAYLSKGKSCANATLPTTGIKINANCSGGYDEGSFVVDYQFNKHFDVYAGLNYSTLNGGLSSGYLSDNQTTVATGLRLRF